MPAIPTFGIGKNGQDPRIWDPGIAITSVDDLDILFLLAMWSVKVPQILKILHASSAAGLSFASSIMELLGITGSLVYGYAMGFPFRYAQLFAFFIEWYTCSIKSLFLVSKWM